MKITRTGNRVKYLEKQKEIANLGCNKCPCRGEEKTMAYYFVEEGEYNKGICSVTGRTFAEGFFKFKYYKVDCYRCLTCGAEWESEKYEYI